MNRELVLLRRTADPKHARMLTLDDLERLLAALADHGSEPIGFAIEVSPEFDDDLPAGWDVVRLSDDRPGETFPEP